MIEELRNRMVTATELKAKCLALLDEVDDRGETITVTKRGRPVATLQPVKKKPWKSPAGSLGGKKILARAYGFGGLHQSAGTNSGHKDDGIKLALEQSVD